MSKLCVVIVFLLTLLGVGWWTFRSTPNDEAQLQKLIDASTLNNREKAGGLTSYCQQLREGVEKELVYRQNETRRIKIISRDSEIFLFRQNKDIEIIEELEEVCCIVQEKLYYNADNEPMQTVHTVEANCATYDYSTQKMTADNAILKKYELLGHLLPSLPIENPTMTGHAKQVTLTMHDEDYDLKAQGLRLILEEL